MAISLVASTQLQSGTRTAVAAAASLISRNRNRRNSRRPGRRTRAAAPSLQQKNPDSLVNVLLPRRRRNQSGPSGFGGGSTAEEVTDGIRLDSKVAIVTGGSSGIGLETSRVLAMRGAHVIIACENLRAAEASKARILAETPDARITAMHLNLGSMYSVKDFAQKFQRLCLPLHILINNAGIANSHFMLSEDGLEMTFAVNHVGHFLLTNLLLDLMHETATNSGAHGRIVIVASSQHDSAVGIDFANLHKKSWMFAVPVLQSVHGLSTVYAQSKLANILHAKELSRRLKERGLNVTVNALHPGVFNTSFVQKFAEPAGLAFSVITPFLKTVQQGAATACYVATHPDLDAVSGKYFADCNEACGSKYINDVKLARELWDYTEELVNPLMELLS